LPATPLLAILRLVFQPGSTVADRFELERLAGAGAMGQVWLARDLETGEQLAVKVLGKSEHQEHAARFLREALLLSQLDHPRIVRYVAHGLTEESSPYLVMEWLEGEDLAQRLQSGPLTIDETISLVQHVAQGLAAAHAAGVIHRDLKPGNLFLPNGSVEAVKVVDFGVARIKDSTWTKTGLMLGTPAYMSPEQAYGQREIDARADLFGLGCVAFECVTGRSAFGDKQVFAVLRKILLEEAPSLADSVPGVAPELDALVKRMMAKDPAARPQSAAEVADELAKLSGTRASIPVAQRPSAPAPSRMVLTEREQRIVTVLSVAEDFSALATDATTALDVLVPSPDSLDHTGTLRVLLERTGGKVGRCNPNSFVLAFPSSGLPTDRATQAAECALLLADVWGGRAMSLASGRLEVGAAADGNAADLAAQLLGEREERAAQPAAAQPLVTNITIDDVTAGLLDARFEIAAGASGLILRGDRERRKDAAPALALVQATPLIGRERELGGIRAILAECIDEPVARVALVTGAAGMGKSRLRRELIGAVSTAEMQVWTAAGEVLHAGLPFGLVSQLTLCAKRPFMGGSALNTMSQQAWVDFLESECEAGPVLIVIDDLQWGDALSLKVLDTALRDLRDSPLMIVAFARSTVHKQFPKLWSDRSIEEIRLSPLTRGASEQLVRGILGQAATDERVARILEQADGVPLYLEALARAVTQGRGDDVPDSVLAMVQSRFERFDTQARRIMRAASVFGRTFWPAGVQALVGSDADVEAALRELVEQKLVSKQAQSRLAEQQEYAFSTTLVCDSAYAMQTDADRALGHDLAAEWLAGAGEPDASVIERHRQLARRRRSEMVERHAAS
jgi:serine/threonine protein kinase